MSEAASEMLAARLSPRDLRVGLARAWLMPCLLCGDPNVAGAAVFLLDDDFAREIDVQARSSVFYALCERCGSLDDWPARVEAEILKDRS